MRILLPKTHIDLSARPWAKMPLVFLAGPARGGGDWQARMCAELEVVLGEDFIAAIPCRWGEEHALSEFFIRGKKESVFLRQLDWERYYIEQAARRAPQGCLLFWLGCQKSPRPPQDGPYAQDTYGELGAWRIERKYRSDTRLVVGAEKGFYGLSQIKRNFRADVRGLTIYRTMKRVAQEVELFVEP